MNKKNIDIFYMKQAIKLAKLGKMTTAPNPNVGCVIVNKNKIVGQGWHQNTGEEHAEIIALKNAGIKAKNATAYITLEPCSHFGHTPPCCVSLINFGISRVVIAAIDPNPQVSGKGIQWLKKKGIILKIGILSQESKNINKSFFKRIQTGLPWIQLKMAISLDGRSALKNGISKWITSIESRKNVHNFRKKANAILSSSQTVITDNPLLNVRYINKNHISEYSSNIIKQPIRIIIDSKNKIQPSHQLINQKGEIWLIRLRSDKKKWPKNVTQIILPEHNKKVDLVNLFYFLGENKINHLWVESGALLFGSILKMKIIDELIIYIAPKLLGNKGKPLCILNNYLHLSQVPNFIIKKTIKMGSDIRLTLIPQYNILQENKL